MLPHVVVVALAGYPLDDGAQHDVAVVAVLEALARAERQRLVDEEREKVIDAAQLELGRLEPFIPERPHPRRVSQQMVDGDRLGDVGVGVVR